MSQQQQENAPEQQKDTAPRISRPAQGYRLLKQVGAFVASCITAALDGIKTAGIATGRFCRSAVFAAGRFFRRTAAAFVQAAASMAHTVSSAFRLLRGACRNAKENNQSAVKACVRAAADAAGRNRALVRSWLNHAAAIAGILVFAAVSIGCSRLSVAVEIVCDGDVVGYVEDETVYQDACRILGERLRHTDVSALSLHPDFHVVLHGSSGLLSAAQLTDNLLGLSGRQVQPAVGVYINDSFFAAAEDENTADELITAYMEAFRADSEAPLTLREEVSFLPGYYLTADIFEPEAFAARLNTPQEDGNAWLHVLQTAQVVYQEEIPFPAEEVTSDKLKAGVRQVTQAGVNGVAQVTASVTTENGVETAREILSTETVTPAVPQITTVGSKKVQTQTQTQTQANYALSAAAGSGTYIWPVNGGYTSAHYGDGRGHKGTDIAAPAGTLIYASRGGTVIRAGWYSGYGLCVMIDHGGGVVTLYGHASRLNVSVGQTVEQGQVIAFVGTTGDSTGNHCHFEIRVNGTCINPENYIGSRSR